MAIHKNIEYNATPGVTVAVFGEGTIGIVTSESSETKEDLTPIYRGILLRSQEHRIIGSTEKTNGEFKPEIALVFYNKEGFNAFKEEVDRIERHFNGEEKFI